MTLKKIVDGDLPCLTYPQAKVLLAIALLSSELEFPPPTKRELQIALAHNPDGQGYEVTPRSFPNAPKPLFTPKQFSKLLLQLSNWQYPLIRIRPDRSKDWPSHRVPNVYLPDPNLCHDSIQAALIIFALYIFEREPTPVSYEHLLSKDFGNEPDYISDDIRKTIQQRYLSPVSPEGLRIKYKDITNASHLVPTNRVAIEYLYLRDLAFQLPPRDLDLRTILNQGR